MNGFVRKAALVCMLGCMLGAAGLGCGTLPTGCGGYGCGGGALGPPSSPTAQELTGCSNQLYDRCYPQRYNYLAEQEVNRTMAPQVLNGHILDQTVWNHYFEPCSDRLTAGGASHLLYLSRRRPQADSMIYLATATDLPYDPACPDQYCKAKQEMDAKRAVAVQKFLAGANCGRPVDFRICVHDPADVSVATVPVANAIFNMYNQYRGSLRAGVGSQSSSVAAGGAATATGGAAAGGR